MDAFGLPDTQEVQEELDAAVPKDATDGVVDDFLAKITKIKDVLCDKEDDPLEENKRRLAKFLDGNYILQKDYDLLVEKEPTMNDQQLAAAVSVAVERKIADDFSRKEKIKDLLADNWVMKEDYIALLSRCYDEDIVQKVNAAIERKKADKVRRQKIIKSIVGKKYIYPEEFNFLVNNADEVDIISKCQVVLAKSKEMNKEKAKKIRALVKDQFITREFRAILWKTPVDQLESKFQEWQDSRMLDQLKRDRD